MQFLERLDDVVWVTHSSSLFRRARLAAGLVLAPASALAQTGGASGTVALGPEASADVTATVDQPAATGPEHDEPFEPGFETGLRIGLGTPVGKAGESTTGAQRDLKDLTPWRTPIWLDVGYRLSETTTLGVYGQVGFGSTGDECDGDCDWSDLRIGVEGQWRLTGITSGMKPWLGLGLGFESLSFRTLQAFEIMNAAGETDGVSVRTAERLSGAELLLQLGLDFRVEDSLDIGPYISATLAQYLTDGFNCDRREFCSTRESLEGSGFHSWLGIGVRGSYLP